MPALFNPLCSAVGLVPVGLLLIWIERNMALPWIGTWIGWPWIFIEGGLGWTVAWNLFTVSVLGTVHAFFVGRKFNRPLYFLATGAASLFMLATWQPTGIVLYQWIPSALISSLLSFLVYWTLLGIALKTLLSPRDASNLTHGLYGHLRHPVYLLAMAAWLCTPMMGLDRLLFAIGMGTAFGISIPWEERRLAKRLVDGRYIAYRAGIPALFPNIKGRKIDI